MVTLSNRKGSASISRLSPSGSETRHQPEGSAPTVERELLNSSLHGLIFHVGSNIFDFLLTQNVEEGGSRCVRRSPGNDRGLCLQIVGEVGLEIIRLRERSLLSTFAPHGRRRS